MTFKDIINKYSPYIPEALIFVSFIFLILFLNCRRNIAINKISENMEMRNETNERYDLLYPQTANTGKKFYSPSATSQPIFCTCDSVEHKTCIDPAARVNSYNIEGITENSKRPDRRWSTVMPYDKFLQTSGYDKKKEWLDSTPYSVFQNKGMEYYNYQNTESPIRHLVPCAGNEKQINNMCYRCKDGFKLVDTETCVHMSNL